MTTLVTGGTGFLGGHLVSRLLERGESVRVLVRREADGSALAGTELALGDVRDRAAVERAVDGCACVYHLAGLTTRERHSRAEFLAVNAAGTEIVASAAARTGARRIVLASSTSVYGGLARCHEIGEDAPLRPDTPYGRSKVEAERVVRRVEGETGLAAVVARIGSTLGPSSKAWAGLFSDIAAGRYRLVGRGENHHHWGHVDDIVEGLVRCGESPAASGGVYNLTGPESAPLRRLVEMIADATGGSEPRRSRLPAGALALYGYANRAAEGLAGAQLPRYDRVEFFVGDRVFDLSRAREELGHVPRIPLQESIRRTAEWLADAGRSA